MNILFWITPSFYWENGLYWLVYNKEFIAKFTLGPGAGEERKSQVDKCSQEPPPTHFHSVNVESECIRYACGKDSQYPGLGSFPSALPAAKRLNPCWPVLQSQREHAILKFWPKAKSISVRLHCCIKFHAFGEWEWKGNRFEIWYLHLMNPKEPMENVATTNLCLTQEHEVGLSWGRNHCSHFPLNLLEDSSNLVKKKISCQHNPFFGATCWGLHLPTLCHK